MEKAVNQKEIVSGRIVILHKTDGTKAERVMCMFKTSTCGSCPPDAEAGNLVKLTTCSRCGFRCIPDPLAQPSR